MHLRPSLLLTCVALVPAAALAAGFGPPLAVPAQPVVPLGPVEISAPPEAPPVAAPPFELVLPDPAAPQGAPDLGVPPGPPDPLPGGEIPEAPPDLTTDVELPEGASGVVLGLAPPFGGELGGGHASAGLSAIVVPEPNTALLLLLGLAGLGYGLRRR